MPVRTYLRKATSIEELLHILSDGFIQSVVYKVFTRALSVVAATAVACCCSVPAIAGTINTYAGTGAPGYSGNGGEATSANLYLPTYVAVDGAGNVIFADTQNHVVRKISPSGTISVLAGVPGSAGCDGDNGPATSAHLSFPLGVVIDNKANVYVVNYGSNTVRKIAPNGVITTVMGGAHSSGTGCGGTSLGNQVSLSKPSAIALDEYDNIYVTDTNNQVIRALTTSGQVSIVAGSVGQSGFAGDGSLSINAKLNFPQGIAFDAQGNLLIADSANQRIREVTPLGVISTIAGNGEQWGSGNGDGGPAVEAIVVNPTQITFNNGILFIAETGRNRIRTIKGGVIETFAGNLSSIDSGYSGDGGLATSATLGHPVGVAVDMHGDVYIGDTYNNRIRVVTPDLSSVGAIPK